MVNGDDDDDLDFSRLVRNLTGRDSGRFLDGPDHRHVIREDSKPNRKHSHREDFRHSRSSIHHRHRHQHHRSSTSPSRRHSSYHHHHRHRDRSGSNGSSGERGRDMTSQGRGRQGRHSSSCERRNYDDGDTVEGSSQRQHSFSPAVSAVEAGTPVLMSDAALTAVSQYQGLSSDCLASLGHEGTAKVDDFSLLRNSKQMMGQKNQGGKYGSHSLCIMDEDLPSRTPSTPDVMPKDNEVAIEPKENGILPCNYANAEPKPDSEAQQMNDGGIGSLGCARRGNLHKVDTVPKAEKPKPSASIFVIEDDSLNGIWSDDVPIENQIISISNPHVHELKDDGRVALETASCGKPHQVNSSMPLEKQKESGAMAPEDGARNSDIPSSNKVREPVQSDQCFAFAFPNKNKSGNFRSTEFQLASESGMPWSPIQSTTKFGTVQNEGASDSVNMKHPERALISCLGGNNRKRQRSSAIRDYPAGCAKVLKRSRLSVLPVSSRPISLAQSQSKVTKSPRLIEYKTEDECSGCVKADAEVVNTEVCEEGETDNAVLDVDKVSVPDSILDRKGLPGSESQITFIDLTEDDDDCMQNVVSHCNETTWNWELVSHAPVSAFEGGHTNQSIAQAVQSENVVEEISPGVEPHSLVDLTAQHEKCHKTSMLPAEPGSNSKDNMMSIVPIQTNRNVLNKRSKDLVSVSCHIARSKVCQPSYGNTESDPTMKELCPESADGVSARSLVKRTLQEFESLRKFFVKSSDAKRADLEAGGKLKAEGRWRNTGEKIIGEIPGVEIGDQFSFRMEMLIIGLHRQLQGGIDYIPSSRCTDGLPIAVSIVASGGYEDDKDSGDTIIYSGQGGNNYKGDKRQQFDQQLVRGNLALNTSMEKQSPVRVIRGMSDANSPSSKVYTYDGLYDVVGQQFERGAAGFGVFHFTLVRRPGQPQVGLSIVKFVGNLKKRGLARPNLLLEDISQGQERLPVCVVNEVDEEPAPTHFRYILNVKYPLWFSAIQPQGCDCTGDCFDESKCRCAQKNGGELPYNEKGHIIRDKKVVYECGSFCQCSSSCPNRVSQKGLRYQLEIFKTKNRGWGVRSVNPIQPGGFICEYTGEILSDAEAEERVENDEYLFDLGNHCTPDGAGSELMNNDVSYTIDAKGLGNVARFINHSCSPNLFAQNVLYDSDDLRFPHVMLFAMENIPPMRELTYDYNYSVDEVRDADGNIKKKACYCGAPDCRGRLY